MANKKENKKTIDIRVINLAKSEAPIFNSDGRKNYVEYGDNNLFPNMLLDLSIKSALHSSILQKKIMLGVGNGFEPIEEDKKTSEFLKNINPNESANEILEKVFNDLEIFGGFDLGISMSRDGKKIASVYHLPWNRMRSGKMDEMNVVNEYFYCEKWEKYTMKSKIKTLDRFSFKEPKKSSELQVVETHKYTPISSYYSVPGYIGGLKSIDTLGEIDLFHNSNLKNGFNPGIIFTFKGSSSDEEQDAIVQALKKKYQGSQNAAEPIILFPLDDTSTPEVKQLETSDIDKLFGQLEVTSTNNVVMAHGIPRILANLDTSSGFQTKELMDAAMIFQSQYVSKQQNLVTDVFNKIMEFNKLKEITITNENASLLLLPESLLERALTDEELREQLGLEPKEVEVVEPETNVEPLTPEDNE